MQSNVALDIDTWFGVFREYLAEKLAVTSSEPHLQQLLLYLQEQLLELSSKWQTQQQVYSESIKTPEIPSPATISLSDDWHGDETVALLLRQNCQGLRFGLRRVRSRATITSHGEVIADSGMLATRVEDWVFAVALEQKDDGYYKTDRVDPYTRVYVQINYRWIKLCDFLAKARSGDEDASPLAYA